jgi:hypothetical protein
MRTDMPSVSSKTEVRNLLSRPSSDWQVLQSHAITGTPCDVPVPRNVIFTLFHLQNKPILKLGKSQHSC